MRDLFKSSLIVVMVRVLGIVLQSIIVILLARVLPVPEMGVFALWYAILGLARMLGPLGTDQTTMRRIAQALENASLDDALHRLLNASVLMVVGVNVILALLLGGVGLISGGFFGDVPGAAWAVLWSALAIPAFAVIGLFTLQLRGFGQQVWAQVPDSIILQVVFGGILLGLGATGQTSLASTMFALFVSAWLVAVMYTFSRVRLGIRRLWPGLADCRALIGEARDMLAALSVTALAVRAPLFIAAWTLGPAAAAVLDIATRFGTLPTITTTSVMATFSPRFAALSDPSRRKELSRVLSAASLLASMPAVATFLVLVVAGPYAIDTVLPDVYRQAYVPMLIICGSQIINSWFGSATNLLMMIGKEAIVRNVSALQLVAVAAGTIIASQAGLVGVAVAVLVAQTLRDGGAMAWLTRHQQVAVPPLGLWR